MLTFSIMAPSRTRAAEMTADEHARAAFVMVRHVTVGDEEQTRIDDPSYLAELPSRLAVACQYMIEQSDYNGACYLYIRWHLLCLPRWEWNARQALLLDAATAVFTDFQDDASEPDDPVTITEWLEAAEAILAPA